MKGVFKMKKLLLLFAVSVIHGSVVFAQDVEELPPEPEVPVVVKQDIPELKVPGGKEVILDVYKVVKGDYLVKIARREYGDSNLWRVIYGYNKYINDPHWIFPGDRIILPRIVDKIPEIPEKEPRAKVEEEEREYGDFLAPPDFEFSGTVIGFKVKKLLQAQGDTLFVDLGEEDGITPNKRLHVYRRGRTIAHPFYGELIGDIQEKIGELRVTQDIESNSSTAKIVYSDRAIEKGDMLLLAK
jgi:hypothetical protein